MVTLDQFFGPVVRGNCSGIVCRRSIMVPNGGTACASSSLTVECSVRMLKTTGGSRS